MGTVNLVKNVVFIAAADFDGGEEGWERLQSVKTGDTD